MEIEAIAKAETISNEVGSSVFWFGGVDRVGSRVICFVGVGMNVYVGFGVCVGGGEGEVEGVGVGVKVGDGVGEGVGWRLGSFQ